MRFRRLATGLAVLALSLGTGPALAQSAAASPASYPMCTADQLGMAIPRAIAGDPTEGMGKLAWNILLRNTGHAGCSLSGWPGLAVTAGGHPVAIASQDVGFSNLAPVHPNRVVLAAGQQAVVTVQMGDTTAGCRGPWQLTLRLPGGAGSLSATQPPGFSGLCGGELLRLSPVYPLSALTKAVRDLGIAQSPSPFRASKAPVPAGCTPGRMRVAASYGQVGDGGSVAILRLVSRGAAACVLPGEWPTITLRAADGTIQIAKAMSGLPRGVTRSPLTTYQARPDTTDVTLSRGTAASVALVTRTTGPGACHVARTATVYPAPASTGAGLTVRLTHPVTFCGLPRVLTFLSGHPSAVSLMAESRALAGGMSPNGDGPAGFWYGTDSSAPVPTRESNGIWQEPNSPTGGAYGGYVGELGAYDHWQGCTSSGVNWNQTAYLDATSNNVHHAGVGAGGYWMMAGPGREPGGYNTSATNAANWGASQAARAVFDIGQTLSFPYIFMDIEAVVLHGWNAGYAGVCSGTETASSIPATLDRDTFNGFWNYVENRSAYLPGVYDAGGSGPNSWDAVFGSGTQLTNTSEWTYVNETSSLSTFPYRWSVNSTVPIWYASPPAQCTLMWQWSGGNGQLNGVGDFDQIDGNRVNSCQ